MTFNWLTYVKVPSVVHSLPATVQLSFLHLIDFFTGFCSLVCKNVQEKRRERERKIGGQKDMSERRIATDLYYYYGENRFAKIKACQNCM